MNLGKRLIACLLIMMLVCGMITVSSAAVATLACPNLQIDGMDCVSKSYPDFLDDFNRAFKQKGRT